LRYLSSLGFAVVGVDRDEAALVALRGIGGAEIHVADIEAGPWPFAPGGFDGVVVTHFLHRPLFPDLVGALRPGGVLIYETFALGNERYGRPSNPAFLLRPDELLHSLEPLAVEQLVGDRKSTRLNSSHQIISYAVFCLKKKTTLI